MSALRPVAVVTGGSRGIGAAVCRELAAQGWSVAVGGSSHMEEAEAVAAGIRRRGGNAAAYRADVRDRAALDAMLGDASLRLGPIGALVCCAGVAQQKLFQDITDEDWDRMFDINIKGVYRSIQAALPYLMKRERSCIVTFSSMWGQVGASCESHYAASKGAVIALTQSLDALAEETPLERNGSPEDVARAAAFLCSEAADFITGQVVAVNGGYIV